MLFEQPKAPAPLRLYRINPSVFASLPSPACHPHPCLCAQRDLAFERIGASGG